MTTLKETLKILNKNVSEADQFKVASDLPSDHFITKFSSTGSPYLDHLCKGIGLGRLTLISGWKSAGKSSFALLAAAAMQKDLKKSIVYFDGENSVDKSYIDRLGIDTSLFIHHNETNLENMLNAAELFSKTDDVGMIVIDSVKSFTSKVIEDKSAEQDTIGVEAKKLNARMPVIIGNCARRKIALVVLNQWRENPGVMHGDNRVLPGGHWQTYHASLHLDFTKKNLIRDVNKSIIGHLTHVRVKKSKYRGFDPSETFDINFYYDFGFNTIDEWTKLLIEKDVIIKGGGGNYTLPNESKIKGLESLIGFMNDNPDYLEEIKKEYESR